MLKKSFFSLGTFALLWHGLCYFKIVDAAFFPSPFSVLLYTLQNLKQDQLLFQAGQSLWRLLVAVLISVPLAAILAILFAHFKRLEDWINPLIALSFPLPKVAILPLLLLIFGIDNSSKIALIAIGIFYIVFLNFRVGLGRLLSSQNADLVHVYPLKRKDYIINFLLKGCQLELLTGLKLGINYGLTLVVVSEFSTSNNGIGYYIWRSWDQFKIISVYSGILIVTVIGFILYYGFELLIKSAQKKFF